MKKLIFSTVICLVLMVTSAQAKLLEIVIDPADPTIHEMIQIDFENATKLPAWYLAYIYDDTEKKFELLNFGLSDIAFFTPDHEGDYKIFAMSMGIFIWIPLFDALEFNAGPPRDSDGDGVFDYEDFCPHTYGTDCNGCMITCTGCAKLSCQKGIESKCIAGDCPNSVCSTDGCGVEGCEVLEYGTFTPKANSCKVSLYAGQCEDNGCSVSCAASESCLIDTDGDDVYDQVDMCPEEYGTVCNGCNIECTGCAVMECQENSQPTCIAGPCPMSTCPASGCQDPYCALNQYALYTPRDNICVVQETNGTCPDNGCSLTCQSAPFCAVNTQTPTGSPDTYLTPGNVAFLYWDNIAQAYTLRLISYDGSSLKVITDDVHQYNLYPRYFGYSFDGEYISVMPKDGGRTIINEDGEVIARAALTNRSGEFDWSKENCVAWGAYVQGIYQLCVDGIEQVLVQTPGYRFDHDPAYAPDSTTSNTRIAGVRHEYEKWYDVYVTGIGSVERSGSTKDETLYVQWLDSNTLIHRVSYAGLFKVTIDTKALEQVVKDKIVYFTVNPSKSRLAYIQGGGVTYTPLYVANTSDWKFRRVLINHPFIKVIKDIDWMSDNQIMITTKDKIYFYDVVTDEISWVPLNIPDTDWISAATFRTTP